MKKILLAIDGSVHSQKLTEEAIMLARSIEAEVTVITVMEEEPNLGASFAPSDTIKIIKENYKKYAEQILAKAEKDFKDNGVAVKTVLANGHAADEICKLANKEIYDMVVIGSRGLGGLREALLGSVSNKVAQCAKAHVLIIK